MTHLYMGVYTKQGYTSVLGNLDQNEHTLEGVINRAEEGTAHKVLVRVMIQDVRIIRPKEITIFCNDQALVKMFTRPVRVHLDYFDLIRQLAAYNKWQLQHQENLPKCQQILTKYIESELNRNTKQPA